FIATQQWMVAAKDNAADVGVLRAQLDSLSATVSSQAGLLDENQTLRDLLDLAERGETSFRPATVLRSGIPGSESMFFLNLGSRDGIENGAPVVDRHGLVGRILEVRQEISVGMDWTHPDFRASAMLQDGGTYGIVENRRGAFREEDRLVLNGTAYYETAPDNTLVLTSGLGGVFPRGIPIGRIAGIEEVQGQWRKAYRLQPMVEPGSVTHVIVFTGIVPNNLDRLWSADSLRILEKEVVEGREP
ncbi:MAG: rod shape-determining protein MreC, partial [Gemmatimonadetes bacterium]|nr:rod shape-determining protein MreC [Gemmatimonadota bacterium]